LKGTDGEYPPAGIGKGQKKPQKENKTVHNQDSTQKPFQSQSCKGQDKKAKDERKKQQVP
jgi:hypothetical protein